MKCSFAKLVQRLPIAAGIIWLYPRYHGPGEFFSELVWLLGFSASSMRTLEEEHVAGLSLLSNP
jgi:hypothetical protein